MNGPLVTLALLLIVCLSWWPADIEAWRIPEDKTKCPKVKALRNFDLEKILGFWYVVEYYASSEELPEYSCFRAELSVPSDHPGVFMNFSYSFIDDPDRELLNGNITWSLPDPSQTAHWVHSEDSYKGVYNTYVLDWDEGFALLLHCAEETGSPRYLSSFVLSRKIVLGANVASYLREKLPKYDVDVQYMFPMNQKDCSQQISTGKKNNKRKNLFKSANGTD